MSTSISNQPPARRIPLSLEVEFKKSYAREADQGLLKNISLTGAFLEHGQNELRTNDKLCVFLKVGGRVRKINAVIIWANELGAGIKFNPFNNRDVQIVDDLMYFVENNREDKKSLFDDILKKVG